MTEMTRQEKIARLQDLMQRIKEIGEEAKELCKQDAELQEEIDILLARIGMEVSLRDEGREYESLSDLGQLLQELEGVALRKMEVEKRLSDIEAEHDWLKERVEAIEVK